MPVTLNPTRCLHIPVPYGGTSIQIYWKEVEAATSYKLEGHYTDTLGDTAPWPYVQHGGGVEKVDGETAIPSEEIAEQPWTTIYSGPGTPLIIDGTDGTGKTWENIDALQATWGNLKAENLNWAQIEELPPDTGPHRAVWIEVPNQAGFATFRLTACSDIGEFSSQPKISRPNSIVEQSAQEYQLKTGETVYVELEGQAMRAMASDNFLVQFDPVFLELDQARTPGGQAGYALVPQVEFTSETKREQGTLKFMCLYRVPEDEMLGAAIARFCFTAKRNGPTTVTLLYFRR